MGDMNKIEIKETYDYSYDEKTDSYRLSVLVDGETVGYADLQVYRDAFDMLDYYISRKDYAEKVGDGVVFLMLKVLHVEKKFRNNGLASKILSNLRKYIKTVDATGACGKIVVEVSPLESSINTIESLLEFYKKYGFKTAGNSGNIYLMIAEI